MQVYHNRNDTHHFRPQVSLVMVSWARPYSLEWCLLISATPRKIVVKRHMCSIKYIWSVIVTAYILVETACIIVKGYLWQQMCYFNLFKITSKI